MKTRVVRHWAHTDWVYVVEKWVQTTADEIFYSWPGSTPPAPAVGSWRWTRHTIPGRSGEPGTSQFSQERATSIAYNLARHEPADDADVVVTFGE